MYSHLTIFVGKLRPCRVCHPYTIHVRYVWRGHIRVTRGRETTSNKKLQRYAQSGAVPQQSCYWGNAILIQNNLLPRSVWLHHKLVCFTLGFTLCFTSGFTLYKKFPSMHIHVQHSVEILLVFQHSVKSTEYWYWKIIGRQLWTCPIWKPLSRSCHCYHLTFKWCTRLLPNNHSFDQ